MTGKEAANASHEEQQRVDLTPWVNKERARTATQPEELESLVERLEIENAQVVEVVEVMNAAIRSAEELRSVLNDVLGPKVLGSQTDVVWSRLYGEEGMAVIGRGRAIVARPQSGGGV